MRSNVRSFYTSRASGEDEPPLKKNHARRPAFATLGAYLAFAADRFQPIRFDRFRPAQIISNTSWAKDVTVEPGKGTGSSGGAQVEPLVESKSSPKGA